MASFAPSFLQDYWAQGRTDKISTESSFSSLSIFVYFPPGTNSLGESLVQLEHLSGSAGTTMVGSFEVAKGLSWWPDGGANGPDSSPIYP